MAGTLTASEEAQLTQTVEMFETIALADPRDCQSLEILKEAYVKLGRQKEVIATSKRIAHAYVLMGQLSSAILEYEVLLQSCPNDSEIKAALEEIESKAQTASGGNGLADSTDSLASSGPVSEAHATSAAADEVGPSSTELDDGRESMERIFLESRLVSKSDFEAYWWRPDPTETPSRVVEPFIQILTDKSILPIEKSLQTLVEKSRLPSLPFDRYDIDIELARSFPIATCLRWCVLPFDHMGRSIFVATANPFNHQAAAELEAARGQRLVWYLVPPADLIKSLQRVFRINANP